MDCIKNQLSMVEEMAVNGGSQTNLISTIISILKAINNRIDKIEGEFNKSNNPKNLVVTKLNETEPEDGDVPPLMACATIIPPCHFESDISFSPMKLPQQHTPSPLSSPRCFGVKELNRLEKYKKTLKAWTRQRAFKVLYNSNLEGLTNEGLNKKIVGIKNVMIFVFDSDNNIFGGFSRDQIPVCKGNDFEYTSTNEEFFVFSLNNKKGVYPIKMERKKGDLGFRISNDNDNVFGIADCFSIVANDKSYIIPTFNKYYNDSTGIGAELFTGNTYPERFKVSYMIAVQWS